MKIIVSMDRRGEVVAKNAQGDILGECFFKMEDETHEEIVALGYRRLVHTYPVTQIETGHGIDREEIGDLFLEAE